MISASDPGVQLHVRNKRLEGRDTFLAERVVLFVPGATYPSETFFDTNLPGGSWVENVARNGSTRPAAMDAPATENPPFTTTADAVKDVGSAVDFILKRRNIAKLNLVGWSWGTAIMTGYTTSNNDWVNKLVLYAPVWHFKTLPPISGLGAYRTVARDPVGPRSTLRISIPGGTLLSQHVSTARC